MESSVKNIIEEIEKNSKEPLNLLLKNLLKENNNNSFHQELLTQILKKHSTTIISKKYLIHSIKYLQHLKLKNWEQVFEDVINDELAVKQLLYFSYHYLKIDFMRSFSNNKNVTLALRIEHKTNKHRYAKLDYTVIRELKILQLKESDFELVHKKLVSEGARAITETEYIIPEVIKINFD